MQTTNYNIRLDKELKDTAFNVFDSYGLTPSQAIKLFLTQVANTKVIPLSFDWNNARIPNAETRQDILDAREEMKTAKSYKSVDEALDELKKIANE